MISMRRWPTEARALGEDHRDRVRLLPRRRRGGPDAQRRTRATALPANAAAPVRGNAGTACRRGRRSSRWWSSPRPPGGSAVRCRARADARPGAVRSRSFSRFRIDASRVSSRYSLSGPITNPERLFSSVANVIEARRTDSVWLMRAASAASRAASARCAAAAARRGTVRPVPQRLACPRPRWWPRPARRRCRRHR